jgi:hypothetical protein
VGVSDLTQLPIALVAFVCMTGAAVAGFFAATAGKERPHGEVHATIRLIANILVVMTTLAPSLMLNSAKNTFEEDNRNIHALATDLILLDRTLKALGSPADEARRQIADYVRISLREANIVEEDPEAEAALDAAGASLRAIRVSDERQIALWNDARQLYRQVVRDRWITVDQLGGTIPRPLVVMLIVWLAAIFASFGYQAPRNRVVAASFALAALLMSAALFLILDMDQPLFGLVKTSNTPFERALEHFWR